MQAEKKVKELGINVPKGSKALAMYVPAVESCGCVYVSGQGPFVSGSPKYTGKVGTDITEKQSQDAAKVCAVNMLSAVKAQIGSLDKVRRVVNIQVFVNSAEGFNRQHVVADAASQLLFDVFGESGRHARTAVGVSQLPLDIPVEINGIFEIG
jgi:enamine deaminase RidA (YjgF/YER057c/UK114 family)